MRPCDYFEEYGLSTSHAPGLDVMKEICLKLGNPQDGIKYIHVAGTNGKGSVSEMLYEILRSAGYSTGLYTSPHLVDFNERIAIDGRYITDAELAETVMKLKPVVDGLEVTPNEFELVTAAMFLFYEKMKPDFVILECGLGGRFDATNVMDSSILSIITGIDLDHTKLLGTTVAEIAGEKAGIIKYGVPVIYGEADTSALTVIEEEARALCAPVWHTDFSLFEGPVNGVMDNYVSYDGKTYRLALMGKYQTRNAATVLTAVDVLRKCGVRISDEDVKNGLINSRWPARFELLNDHNPLIIYDGAHNPQGIRSAVENISCCLSPLSDDGKVVLLMGVMADKNYSEMVEMLAPYVRRVFTVLPTNKRSLGENSLLDEFKSHNVDGDAYSDIEKGVREAAMFAKDNRLPMICLGSLYLYGDVKNALSDIFTK